MTPTNLATSPGVQELGHRVLGCLGKIKNRGKPPREIEASQPGGLRHEGR
jgi:hypothetical protein